MKKHVFLLVSGILCTFWSCQSSGDAAQNPILIEANEIHQEAITWQKIAEKKLDSLETVASDSVSKMRLTQLKMEVEAWEETLFEVPGFEHTDHSGHDHHHHNEAPQVTPEQMLLIQKEARDTIKELVKKM